MVNHAFRMLLFILLSSSIVLLSNCKSAEQPIENLHKEVMKIHDEVMPKQSALSGAQLKVKKWLAQQESDFTPGLDLMDNLKALSVAEESMWEWMNQYSKPKGDLEEGMAYLEEQKVAIQKISDKMNKSLQSFEKIQSKYGL